LIEDKRRNRFSKELPLETDADVCEWLDMTQLYTPQRMLQLYGSEATRSAIIAAEKSGHIPAPERMQTGSLSRRVWPISTLPELGERYGFMARPKRMVTVAIYSAKGGVFKTSLALNMGRMAALHGIRTCIIGLDFQCDITRLLDPPDPPEDETGLNDVIARVRRQRGLLDLFGDSDLETVRGLTDIPTLHYIPETAGLISLDRSIGAQDRREYVLGSVLQADFSSAYELDILDCPPSWSHLITNALVACDLLVTPLECKASQFSSLSVFVDHLKAFRETMELDYEHIYVPTRYAPNRRLSTDIRNWYVGNLERVSMGAVRESAIGEEAIASRVSLPEHSPNSPYADEMRELLRELWAIAVPNSAHKSDKSLPAGAAAFDAEQASA